MSIKGDRPQTKTEGWHARRAQHCYQLVELLVSCGLTFPLDQPDLCPPWPGPPQPALTTCSPLGQLLATSVIWGPDFAKKNKAFVMLEGRVWGQPLGVEISIAALIHRHCCYLLKSWRRFTRCTADGARRDAFGPGKAINWVWLLRDPAPPATRIAVH